MTERNDFGWVKWVNIHNQLSLLIDQYSHSANSYDDWSRRVSLQLHIIKQMQLLLARLQDSIATSRQGYFREHENCAVEGRGSVMIITPATSATFATNESQQIAE